MSGDEKQPDLHKAEHQKAAQQNGTLDAVMDMTKVINPWGPKQGFHFGGTSFEDYDLNEMIDIVESANPELLENAGTALVDARDAISKAADELSTNLGGVDWEGEAHTAFSTWGNDLVTTALALADYADVVGTQIMAAGSGLASVRKSMPPRDTRTDRTPLRDIPEAEQVDSNDAYTAAVKAESHRQEAINQMYRLASYYTVSGGAMQAAEEPVFPKMPDAGVPAPPPDIGLIRGKPIPTFLPAVSEPGSAGHQPADSAVTRPRAQDLSSPHRSVGEPVRHLEHHVGTEIDSVGTLPPQGTVKPTSITPPSTTGPNATNVGTAPPLLPVVGPPASQGPTRRTSRFGGIPGTEAAASAQGRGGGTTGRAPVGRGTGPIGQMGRAAAPGQASGRTVGPMERGVIGGVPKAGGPAAKQSGGVSRGPVTGMGATNPGRTGSGRSGMGLPADGVVGGKPVTGSAPGANGSRVPRGTVVGGEGVPASRVTGERPGRRGVVGAPSPTTGAGQASRRPVASSDGVVGTPKGRTPGTRSSGVKPGSVGVTCGPEGNQGAGETRSRREERRDGASSTD